MRYMRLWLGLGAVIVGSFAVLGYFGRELYRQAPPIPDRVVTTDGRVLFTGQDIQDGQNVWQSMGGQEVGTVWGHGAYVAPDWSADWLHREATWILDHWAEASRRQDLRRAGRRSPRGAEGAAQGRAPRATPTTRRPATWPSRRCGPRRSPPSPRTTRRCSAMTRRWTSCATPTRSRPTRSRLRSGSTSSAPSSSGPPGPARRTGPGPRSPTRTTGRPRS